MNRENIPESVLITGGTGSFGQAFAARLVSAHMAGPNMNPKRVCIYSRGEHTQAAMAEQFNHKKLRFFIGDVRDRERLCRAMEGCDIVVHAAALKRIEVGHYCPSEMVKTNVLGSMNVIEAAKDAGVKKVVALSTDKAYQPVSPYGQSKALAESLFRNAYQGKGPIFAVTRYGNVWGSRGSVVPKWKELMRFGRTVPVTDPDVTRFYMTLEQAVDLVWRAICEMKGGELFVPAMPAYRLGDLAEAMGAKMDVIGLPKWEKLHESMEDGNCSKDARRMSIDELKEILREPFANIRAAGPSAATVEHSARARAGIQHLAQGNAELGAALSVCGTQAIY